MRRALLEAGTVSLRLHGDTLARPGELDFATCLWPGAPPAALTGALARGLEECARYPDERAARERVAARHGRQPEEVLLLNGACEAFWLLAHALRPRNAACVHPSFTEPEAALRAVGADVVRVRLDPDSWSLDPSRIPDETELVVIGNPNNPTGTLASAAALASLASPARRLVVDESFIELTEQPQASLAARADIPGLIVVRSITKLFGLAGIRAGYLLAEVPLVAELAAQRQPWSVNTLACRALAACAADDATPRRVASEVATARAELLAALASRSGLRVWPSAANFLLLRSGDPTEPRLAEALADEGIAVRSAASFPGLDERYLRVAVRPPADNARLLAALDEVLGR
jgi:histidinol-phosphate/aromatic aminotransferase/cobyric acid decarboxylase-like protein